MTTNPSETGLLSDPVEDWADTKPDDIAISYQARQWTWSHWRDPTRSVGRTASGIMLRSNPSGRQTKSSSATATCGLPVRPLSSPSATGSSVPDYVTIERLR